MIVGQEHGRREEKRKGCVEQRGFRKSVEGGPAGRRRRMKWLEANEAFYTLFVIPSWVPGTG